MAICFARDMKIYTTRAKYLKDMSFKHVVDKKTFKRHNKYNSILNAVFVFFFTIIAISSNNGNVPFGEIAIMYIVFDILGFSVLDDILFTYCDRKERNRIQMQLEEFRTMDIEKLQEIRHEIESRNHKILLSDADFAKKNYFDDKMYNAMCKYRRDMEDLKSIETCIHEKWVQEARDDANLQEVQNSVNEYNKEENELKKMNEDSDWKAIGNAEKIMENAGLDGNPAKADEITERYDRLVSYGKILIEKAKESPHIISRMDKTFNIYFTELKSLMDEHMHSGSTACRKEHTEIISDIMDSFEKYLEHINSEINRNYDFKFKVSAYTLKEELEKEMERKGGDGDNVQE